MAEYAADTESEWARELAYRMMVLQTYDVLETGVTEDNIDGGVIVNGDWLNIAHPLPLRWMLAALGWLPEELGASRENHVVRSTAVVNSIDQQNEKLTEGIVKDILTNSPSHPHGIKVRLMSGEIGRIKVIF